MQIEENNISTDEMISILNNIQQKQEEQQTEIQQQQQEIQQQLEDLSTSAPSEEEQQQQQQEQQEILLQINENIELNNAISCGFVCFLGVIVGVLLIKIFFDRWRNI